MTLTGTTLSTSGAPAEREVYHVCVEMLPLQHAGHLENFADYFGSGWLEQETKLLRLQFQLVALFGSGQTDGLWISVPDGAEKIALSPTCVASPVVGQRQPQLPWSAQSRFVVDEIVELPDWAVNSDKLEILAEVAGKWERVGVIHASQALSGSGGHDDHPVVVDFTPVMVGAPATLVGRVLPVVRRVVDRIKDMDRLVLFIVVLPTLLSAVYFGLIVSDVYISESKFVVRGTDQQATSPLGMIFKGAGFSRSQDDSYSVQEFILSRDALHMLEDRMSIGKAFSSKNVDVFSRFAGLEWDNSFEALYKYYQNKVDLQIDNASSIATLTTRAFTSEDSLHANQLLLERSETLVNQLNERGRLDMINFAEREVAAAEKQDWEATLSLARLQTENTRGHARGRSLASKFTEYQRLALEKEYADKMLASALSSLEEARNQALRKQLYLERITQPSRPDVAMEPRRLRAVLGVFVLGLVVWGVLTMLIAGIKEHQD